LKNISKNQRKNNHADVGNKRVFYHRCVVLDVLDNTALKMSKRPLSNRWLTGSRWQKQDVQLLQQKEAVVTALQEMAMQNSVALTPPPIGIPTVVRGGLQVFDQCPNQDCERKSAPPFDERQRYFMKKVVKNDKQAFVYKTQWMALSENNATINQLFPNLGSADKGADTATYPAVASTAFFQKRKATIVAATSVGTTLKARNLESVSLVPSLEDPLLLGVIMNPPADDDAPYLIVYGQSTGSCPVVGKVGVFETATLPLRSGQTYEFYAGNHAPTTQPVLDGKRPIQRFIYRVPDILLTPPDQGGQRQQGGGARRL
jgi:hypothetical protein